MRRTARALDPTAPAGRQQTVAWQTASLLLGYPDDTLFERLPLMRKAVTTLTDDLHTALGTFLDHVESTTPLRLAAHYVETFDTRRRCCLYLTYYAYGDTRKRGMALLQFKDTYRAAGLQLTDTELPDHLAVVLEFGATANLTEGRRLLLEHRAGLELLRLALTDAASPYAGVVTAVCRTLPPLQGEDRDAVARLAAEGPPSEDVGLQPFAPPEYMPDTMRARR
jgi:nitrate reductase molybdenum cofactor assembly chaperone